MKKFFFVKAILISFLMLFIVTPMAMATLVATVGGSGYGPYQTGNGGEFTLQVLDSSLSWILTSYVPGVTSDILGTNYLHNFQTFCVEEDEYIYPWATYDVTISDHSIYSGQPLTQGAAWLYEQFHIGQLQGYDYTRNPNNGANETQQLQTAIWYFMGVGNNPNNQFSILGNNHGGMQPNNGQYPVAVLNLWVPGHIGQYDFRRQDQLVSTPVPEPATMLLLGSGLIGLAGYGRKKFFKK